MGRNGRARAPGAHQDGEKRIKLLLKYSAGVNLSLKGFPRLMGHGTVVQTLVMHILTKVVNGSD